MVAPEIRDRLNGRGLTAGRSRRGVADINAVVNELASAGEFAVVFASSTGKHYSHGRSGPGKRRPLPRRSGFTRRPGGCIDHTGGGTDRRPPCWILYLVSNRSSNSPVKQTPRPTKPYVDPDFSHRPATLGSFCPSPAFSSTAGAVLSLRLRGDCQTEVAFAPGPSIAFPSPLSPNLLIIQK